MMREVITMKLNNLSYVQPEDLYSAGEATASITVQDEIALSTGIHQGRIKSFSTFKSKDRETTYAKITVGTQINLSDNQQVVVELDRVWLADYRQGSHLIQQLEQLGAIEGKQFYPDRIFNLPVSFEVQLNKNASTTDKFKEHISSINLIEHLPDDADFRYVKVRSVWGYEIVPTNDSVQIEGQKSKHTSFSELLDEAESDDEDDDFLDDSDFEDDEFINEDVIED